MKKISLLIILFCGSYVFAQNTAFIHRDSILSSVKNYKINLTKVDTLAKRFQKEIELAKAKVKVDFNKIIEVYNPVKDETLEIIKKRMSVSDVTKIDLIVDENALLEKKLKSYNSIVKSEYDQTVSPIIQKVNKILETYALKNKIDTIYIIENIGASIAYINKNKIVTKEIIAMLK